MGYWKQVCGYICKSKQDDVASSSQDNFLSRFVDSKIFLPRMAPIAKSIIISPASYSLPHEIVVINTKDGLSLMAYLLLQIDQLYDTLPTIIMYHGNGGNIGDCLPIAEKFFRTCGCNIFMVEYRGYGLSEGIPSEKGVYMDAQAAFDYVVNRPDLDSDKIILYGLSLGGAIAIDLASREEYKNRVAAIIVENTFSSLDQLALQLTTKCCSPLIKFLELTRKFPSIRKISYVDRPILFISGLKDKFILPDHSTKLFMECPATSKQIIRIPDGEHLNTWSIPDHTEAVKEFIFKFVSKTTPRYRVYYYVDDEDELEGQELLLNSL
ncbi:unnamed protein product [Allacma fusca]|uniref:Protein ABHD13 n=1 Tax=Allacma fusca TaxID=39272 RepID=A0A8J2LH27_9HEXA|nr:unnamed protein product [Allacma fusca]